MRENIIGYILEVRTPTLHYLTTLVTQVLYLSPRKSVEHVSIDG
jgi:hypothetical protein